MKWVDEISVLRSVACLSIVFLHAIKHGLPEIGDPAVFTFYDSLYLILYFGTPLFIFISEFLLAHAYKEKELPKDFLRKRVRFILLPYVCMAFFYAIPHAHTWESFSVKLLMNVFIGDFHGYFILIIFQFYLLHMWLHRFLSRLTKKQMAGMLAAAFIVNAGYLAVFNFTDPYPHMVTEYIWQRFYWIPFPGWVFYFFLGYVVGTNVQGLFRFLQRNKIMIYTASVLSTALLLVFYYTGWITTHSSKRIDILFHSVAIGMLIMYGARRLGKVPMILEAVSRYSFGIYLLHIFYISLLETINPLNIQQLDVFYIPLLFASGVVGAMVTTWMLSKWRYGAYIIGQIRPARHATRWNMYDFFPIHTFYMATRQKIKKE